MPKSASFDVIGTCFDFDNVIETIGTRLASQLSSTKPPIDPKTLFFSWFYAAQRDFTYLSLASSYTPIGTVLSSTFPRAAYTVGIAQGSISQDDVSTVMAAFKAMPPRPGLKLCIDGLRDAGWVVNAVTNGARATSLGYFERAEIAGMAERLVSCDEVGRAKPEGVVYERAVEVLGDVGGNGSGSGERWFVAAHAWDLIAARKAGFKTAWVAFEEKVPVKEVFGEFDLYAEDMAELLEKLKTV